MSNYETVWKVCWLPIGGYVHLRVASNIEASLIKKIGATLSGPVFSVAFAFVILFVLYTTKGALTIQGGEIVLVQQSTADSFLKATHSLVWTWVVWKTDAANMLASAYDAPMLRLTFLIAIWSSKFGILNLLPLPKFDGWGTLHLILDVITSPDQAVKIMKWLFRLIVGLLVFVFLYVTWIDLFA